LLQKRCDSGTLAFFLMAVDGSRSGTGGTAT
jgi:hypothetical protein